jgi:hypothetical protein
MKNWLIRLVILIVPLAGHTRPEQDILIKTRFDKKSSANLTQKMRKFLVKNDFGDPYNYIHSSVLTLDLNETIDLPKDSQDWIRELQSILRLSLLDSRYTLKVEKLGYSIADFVPDLRSAQEVDNRIEYVTVSTIQGISITANKVIFEVELIRAHAVAPVAFNIELHQPKFTVSPELLSEINMGWMTSLLPGQMLLSLVTIDMHKVLNAVVKRPDLVDFSMHHFTIPDVSIRVGHKELKLDKVKLASFLERKKPQMKKSLLDVMNQRLGANFKNLIADAPKEIMINRRTVIDGMVKGSLHLESMDTDRLGLLELRYSGKFCSEDIFKTSKDCRSPLLARTRREISKEMSKSSVKFLNHQLLRNENNIAVSVSEQYLNNLIDATVLQGLWEKELANKPFKLGPEKAFILAEEAGENFSFFMDIIYPLSRTQRLLVGRSELRFPVKFFIGMQVLNSAGLPRFRITVNDILMDVDALLYGMPQYGLPSTVQNGRFKGKVLDKIFEDLASFKGETLFEMELGEFKDTYLEELDFYSDGAGRATAVLGFK